MQCAKANTRTSCEVSVQGLPTPSGAMSEGAQSSAAPGADLAPGGLGARWATGRGACVLYKPLSPDPRLRGGSATQHGASA